MLKFSFNPSSITWTESFDGHGDNYLFDVGLPGFEPGSSGPKPLMIDTPRQPKGFPWPSYTTAPLHYL